MPSPMEIKCMECIHFQEIKKRGEGLKTTFAYVCSAFPEGIPESVRSWEKPHIEIMERQKGIFVFKPKTEE